MISIDTSAWFARLSDRDVHRTEAGEFFARIGRGQFGAPITTDYVVEEAFTLLAFDGGSSRFVDLATSSVAVPRSAVSRSAKRRLTRV
jgi:predicted nucleic acid-binding protein